MTDFKAVNSVHRDEINERREVDKSTARVGSGPFREGGPEHFNERTQWKQSFMRRPYKAVPKHLSNLPTELDHNLQDCAICLRAFLPQAYERRIHDIEKARAEGKILAPKPTLKRRGEGAKFQKLS